MALARIVSGGQTGVDRAALEVAIEHGIPYGGWCPLGGWAEDHVRSPGLLAAFPELRETPTADPNERTEWNVRDSDATLVLELGRARSPGTRLTREVAERLGRPLLAADLAAGAAAEIAAFVERLPDGGVLNVAGPRESEAPGIQAAARRALDAALRPGRSARPPGWGGR